MTIVDTSVWIDYFRGMKNPETSWLDRQLGIRTLALTDLILCELLQGVRDESSYKRLYGELSSFPAFATGGVELAVAAAANYRRLRARGCTVRTTIDSLIATYCLKHNHSLLHRDRDFDAFERELGLQVIHP